MAAGAIDYAKHRIRCNGPLFGGAGRTQGTHSHTPRQRWTRKSIWLRVFLFADLSLLMEFELHVRIVVTQ